MRATNDLGELRARMECGLATARDTKVLFSYIDHLVWKSESAGGREFRVCRFCGALRGADHASSCPVAEVR